MISFFIDTCYKKLIIAIYKGEEQLFYLNEESNNNLSEKLLPKIKEIFNNLSMKVEDIDVIYAVNGPGSFTGIRIGLTFCKVLAWTLNKKVITISELELLASINTDKKYIIPLIDARRDYVYAGIYDHKLLPLLNDQYIKIDDLLLKVKDYKGEDILFISLDEFDKIKSIKPDIDILKLIKMHQSDSPTNPNLLNPNYLKKTEAEEKLEV